MRRLRRDHPSRVYWSSLQVPSCWPRPGTRSSRCRVRHRRTRRRVTPPKPVLFSRVFSEPGYIAGSVTPVSSCAPCRRCRASTKAPDRRIDNRFSAKFVNVIHHRETCNGFTDICHDRDRGRRSNRFSHTFWRPTPPRQPVFDQPSRHPGHFVAVPRFCQPDIGGLRVMIIGDNSERTRPFPRPAHRDSQENGGVGCRGPLCALTEHATRLQGRCRCVWPYGAKKRA